MSTVEKTGIPERVEYLSIPELIVFLPEKLKEYLRKNNVTIGSDGSTIYFYDLELYNEKNRFCCIPVNFSLKHNGKTFSLRNAVAIRLENFHGFEPAQPESTPNWAYLRNYQVQKDAPGHLYTLSRRQFLSLKKGNDRNITVGQVNVTIGQIEQVTDTSPDWPNDKLGNIDLKHQLRVLVNGAVYPNLTIPLLKVVQTLHPSPKQEIHAIYHDTESDFSIPELKRFMVELMNLFFKNFDPSVTFPQVPLSKVPFLLEALLALKTDSLYDFVERQQEGQAQRKKARQIGTEMHEIDAILESYEGQDRQRIFYPTNLGSTQLFERLCSEIPMPIFYDDDSLRDRFDQIIPWLSQQSIERAHTMGEESVWETDPKEMDRGAHYVRNYWLDHFGSTPNNRRLRSLREVDTIHYLGHDQFSELGVGLFFRLDTFYSEQITKIDRFLPPRTHQQGMQDLKVRKHFELAESQVRKKVVMFWQNKLLRYLTAQFANSRHIHNGQISIGKRDSIVLESGRAIHKGPFIVYPQPMYHDSGTQLSTGLRMLNPQTGAYKVEPISQTDEELTEFMDLFYNVMIPWFHILNQFKIKSPNCIEDLYNSLGGELYVPRPRRSS